MEKNYVKKETLWGKLKTKISGGTKRAKNGVKLTDSDGKITTLLTPAGKGAKYAKELKDGKRITNSGSPKIGENGQQMGLTKQQRAYRAGYLAARKDNAKAYNAKKDGNK